MSPSALLFILLFVFILLHMPIAISLGASAVITMLVFPGGITTSLIPLSFFTSCDSFPLLAVPFFILSGDLMLHGGISQRLIRLAMTLVGHFRAALATVSVVCCMFFSALSGSGPATAAAIGSIMIPEMKKQGYPASFAASLISCAGSMGPVIPPSIFFIIYGVTNGVSVSSLFMAGIIPGILMALCLSLYSYFACRKHGFGPALEKPKKGETWKAFKDAFWGLLTPVIILGGIYGGICTPTEAAVLACVYAIIVGIFVYKEITSFKQFLDIVTNSINTTGLCLIVMGTASIFGRFLTLERVPMMVATLVGNISNNLWVVMILINIFLLIVGMFMDIVPANVIISPILLPIVASMGMSPIQFGCVMCVNLVIGLTTPPVGVNTFVAAKIGDVGITKMFRWLYPMIASLLVALLLVTYIPQVSLFLPSLLN